MMDELQAILDSATDCTMCGRYVDTDEPYWKVEGDFPGPVFHEDCAPESQRDTLLELVDG